MKLLLYDYLPKGQNLSDLDQKAIVKFGIALTRIDKPIDFIRELLNVNTDDSDLILTFLSHANEIRLGDGKNNDLYKIPYDVLLPILNRCRTKHRLFVNMMANCKSYGIENYKTLAPLVDEFWVTTQDAMSIPHALTAVSDYLQYGDSDLFEERNDNNTDFLFKRLA